MSTKQEKKTDVTAQDEDLDDSDEDVDWRPPREDKSSDSEMEISKNRVDPRKKKNSWSCQNCKKSFSYRSHFIRHQRVEN